MFVLEIFKIFGVIFRGLKIFKEVEKSNKYLQHIVGSYV